jgi:hypothetical protein
VTYLDGVAADIRNAVPPDALPNEDTSILFLMYAVLLLAKGEMVTAEDVHNAWVAWMEGKGEEHESMVAFDELPLSTREEDSSFVVAIRRVAHERGIEGAPQSS